MTTAPVVYQPHKFQRDVHKAYEILRRVVVASRQAGKTVLGAQEIGEWGMSAPKRWPEDTEHQFWWLTRTYKTKPKAWRDLTNFIPKGIVSKRSDHESTLILKNGAQISVRSADGKDSLVSERLHGCVLDEFTLYPEDVWYQQISPMLATTNGPALFLGTARGHNWGYNVYQNARRGMAGWASFHWTIYDTPYVTPEWIAATKLGTPERVWRQEYLAEFLTDGGEVFRNIDACIGPRGQPDDNVSIGFDLARTKDWSHLMAFNSRCEWLDSRRVGHLDWSVQRVAAIEMYRRLKARKIVIDVTGIRLGEEAVAYDLRREGLNVETVQFTAETKRAAIENLMLKFDLHAIRIPEESAEQFREYEAVELPSGNERFTAPEGKHDDEVMAAALGIWGVRHISAHPLPPVKSELDLLVERELRAASGHYDERID